MSQKDVRALIETRLADWAADNDLTVAWENKPFTPPPEAYVKFNLLPAQTRDESLSGDLRTWLGIAQITVAVPADNGPCVAEDFVNQLDTLFPCATRIAGAALSVLILTPVAAANGFMDSGHYLVPVSFQYRADIAI